jgi:hypothetical protein
MNTAKASMTVTLRGSCIRLALMDRRTELIRCASITKDNTFDAMIQELDEALFILWDAKKVTLTEVV